MGKAKRYSKPKGGKAKKTKRKGKKKVDIDDLHHALQIQKFEAQEAANRPDKRGKKKDPKPVEIVAPDANRKTVPEEPCVQISTYDSLLGSLGVVSDSSSDEEVEHEVVQEINEGMEETGVSIDAESDDENDVLETDANMDLQSEDDANAIARDLECLQSGEDDECSDEDDECSDESDNDTDLNQFNSFDVILSDEQKQVGDKWSLCDIPGWKVASTVALTGFSQPSSFADIPASYSAEEKLCRKWSELMAEQDMESAELEQHNSLFASLNSYRDILFPAMDHKNGSVVRALYSLHAVNHVLKARRRVMKNSEKVRLAAQKPERLAELEETPQLRDQGFTRPRVLIVAPFRSVAYELVQMIKKLCPHDEVMNYKRFEEEFSPEEGHGRTNMAADWLHLFEGNYDDKFRIGLSFSRKTIKLYAPFYGSDIIICSPLGLRLVTGLEGDGKRDVDFLSSIEMLIVDRADALRMQNWDHFTEILDAMNRKPKVMRDIDIRRIRPSVAAGESRCFRQTIIFSDGANADYSNMLVDLVNHDDRKKEEKQESDEEQDVTMFDIRSFKATNYRGRQRFIVHYPCALQMPLARQMFHHCPCSKPSMRHKAMYEYFENTFWPDVGRGLEQLLVFVPSYGDYMKVRRLFKDESINFGSLCEYSSNSDLSIKRRKFQNGEIPVIIITERFAWFRRYRMRGTKHVLFFGPPQTPIYNEVLSWIDSPGNSTAITLYTPFDAMQLERVVGSTRTKTLVTSSPGKLFCYT